MTKGPWNELEYREKNQSMRAGGRDAVKAETLYKNGYLFVAAVRVLENRKSAPPSIEDVCEMLAISLEQGSYICRKLKEHQVVEMVESAYGPRLFIKDHLRLEEIPSAEQEDRLGEALKEFQTSRQQHSSKIAAIQKTQQEKKKNLFADLEKQLKKNLNKK